MSNKKIYYSAFGSGFGYEARIHWINPDGSDDEILLSSLECKFLSTLHSPVQYCDCFKSPYNLYRQHYHRISSGLDNW